jgi:translation initiation factor 2B subunit (eIF-2B alpha/beta/delta family)
MVQEGDSILITHPSTILEKVIYTAVDQGKRFTLYLLGNNCKAFQDMAIRLQTSGIKIVYAHLNNMPYYIKEIDKIFITSICVYSNGSVLTESGAASVAIFAHIFKKPVYLFTRTYKFSLRTQIDYLSVNEASTRALPDTPGHVYELRYELLPCKYFSVFVTEIGIISPWSVPMLVRRFSAMFEKSLNETSGVNNQ